MKNLKGTKTEQNLKIAFQGESEARNKYTYFASAAKSEGYEAISKIFLDTAGNEKEHAEIWYKLLYGIGNTKENLQNAIDKEYYEYSKMYPEFAKVAKEEGFDKISKLFSLVAQIEFSHYERYKKLYDLIESEKIFSSDKVELWRCSNCGYGARLKAAPQLCPVCEHKRGYFERCMGDWLNSCGNS